MSNKNKNKNEELQSRREFFKKAAKAALPVVGAVVMASLPNVMQAATGCHSTCMGYCVGCSGTCSGTCKGTCRSTCIGGCSNGGA